MAGELRLRRGTSVELDNFTGAVAEIVADTTKSTARIHNGQLGGAPISETVNLESVKDLAGLPAGFLRRDRIYVTPSFWPDLGIGYAKRRWNPDRPKADHDGGKYIDPNKLSDLGLHTDADPFTTYMTPASTGTGCFELVGSVTDIGVYGALPLDGFDNAKPMQACGNSIGAVPVPFSIVPFELSRFESVASVKFVASQGKAFIKLQNHSSDFGVLMSHPNCYFDDAIQVDCDSTGRGAVQAVDAHDSQLFVSAINVQAKNGGSTVLAGLAIANSDRVEYSAKAKSFSNLDQPNESLPRIANLTGSCEDCRGRFVEGYDIDGAGFLDYSSGVRNTLDVLNVTLCGDNGVYASVGKTHIGKMIYDGSEEAIVAIGNSSITIDHLTIRGTCATVLNISQGDSIRVGHLHFESDSKASAIARVRPNNTSSGSIKIGKLTGSCNLGRLLAFDTVNGAIDEFEIASGDFEYLYDPATSGGLSQWGDLRAVTGKWNLKNLNITIKHITGAAIPSSDIFWIESVNTTGISVYDNVKVFMPDGGAYRGRFAFENVRKTCGNYQVSIGPYAREVDYIAPFNAIESIPTTGYWHKGERYITTSGDEVVCTVSGASGATWKTISYNA